MLPDRYLINALRVLHFTALALWLGGVLSCLPLLFQADVTKPELFYHAYTQMRAIAWNVIGWGGIFGLVSGLLLVWVAKWNLQKNRWVQAKLVLTLVFILFGMFYNEHRILTVIARLEETGIIAMQDTELLSMHQELRTGMLISAFGFILLIVIAVFKPGMQK